MEQQKDENIEKAFNDLFKSSTSGSGEEELLRIVSDFSLQLTSPQIRALLWLKVKAKRLRARGKTDEALVLDTFVDEWVRYKKNNFSDVFMMRAVESLSLKKFIGQNAIKVDVMK